MTNMEKLVQAFTHSLALDAEAVTDTLQYGDATWDSVAHMAIVVAIENAFDIMLDTDDVIDLSSFTKAKEIVGKYGVNLES